MKRLLSGLALTSVLLGGCSSGHRSSGPTTSSPTTAGPAPATTVASVAPPTAPVTVGATTTTTVAAGPAPCRAGDLAGSLGQPNGAAGRIIYPLLLANTATKPCTLEGYPGVSFVTGPSGAQVGAPASRSPGSYSTVLLQPGQSAQALLAISDPANYPSSCQVTDVPGLKVFPPGQTASLYIAHPDRTCANPADGTLQVTPLSPAG